jgi:hypothetical protein
MNLAELSSRLDQRPVELFVKNHESPLRERKMRE